MQPPLVARNSSILATAQSSTAASPSTSLAPPPNVSLFPSTSAGPSPSASTARSPRNPLSSVSFSPAARRPSFDLAAELLHSAADLRTATDGQRQICVPGFPSFLANALDAVLIQAKAIALLPPETMSTAAKAAADIPSLSRSMALLACLRHALPVLSEMAEPFITTRESLLSLVASDDAAETDLLDFSLAKAKTIPFTASSALCGEPHRINVSATDETKKHFGLASARLSVDLSQAVILVAAYTFSSQHHLLARRYRGLAEDIVAQYESRATYAAKTALAGLEMVEADLAIRRRNRERERGERYG